MTTISVQSGSGPVEVKIDRQGRLCVFETDRDAYEYDLAFDAMGGDKSMLLMVMELYSKSAPEALLQLVPGRKDVIRVGLEGLERAASVVRGDGFVVCVLVTDLCKAIREHLSGELTAETERSMAGKIASHAHFVEAHQSLASEHLVVAGLLLYSIIKDHPRPMGSIRALAGESVNRSVLAVGVSRTGNDRRSARGRKYRSATGGEMRWQIRRLVKVVYALQHGKPWPKIEQTP
jgi:hypothetical protein